MTDTPKKRGGARAGAGRPRKYVQPENAPERSEDEEFLDEILSRPKRRIMRQGSLVADDKTLRTIFECAKLFCSQDEIASVLGCARSTFQNFMREVPAAREAWEDGLQHAKVSLRRKQLALADKNAPAAIFLGKNYLGQKDEHHTTTTVNKPANEMSEEQLLEIAMRGQFVSEPVSLKPGKKAH